MNLNVEDKTASLRGDMVVANAFSRMGSYYLAGDRMFSIGELDGVSSFLENVNTIRITSYKRDLFCTTQGNPCRMFETLSFDTDKNEALYEREYSYNPIFGAMIADSSIKFRCTKE